MAQRKTSSTAIKTYELEVLLVDGVVAHGLTSVTLKLGDSPVGTDQFLNLIVIADEEENQVRRGSHEDEGQPAIQAEPTLGNRLGKPPDADA